MSKDVSTVEVPAGTCLHEFMDGEGWSDGFPLVPPTEGRVSWMLQGTRREPDSVLGRV